MSSTETADRLTCQDLMVSSYATPRAIADVEDTCRMADGIWKIAARQTTLIAGHA